MALLRLTATSGVAATISLGIRLGVSLGLALGLGACTLAGAQATERMTEHSGLTAPAGWRDLPELASRVGASLAERELRLDGVEAWGEPARGCFGVWLAIRGDGATAAQVLAGLAAEDITTTDVVTPPGAAGVVTATFAKGAHHGRLRARVAAGTITALACFANAREPASCETPCTLLLGGLP